ncbi:molybdopterin-dependent oxidoreductase [Irregularibacter muris]|uniref:Molybdopterin-dependent oxidoreductase n=1 Tax=Irregularibacter muris TaxID=1796619 RepID=A0AAE3L434_9FIRM|nr:molybdopterin cofactor-binding domain-containing protein [Irregularibacter muris]MCR1899358.1 molybdopterin-dependent oxidoreductase [Irregularibacter muris]
MYKSVGKRVKKYDGEGIVTGKIQYVSDVSMPDMLVCKTLRSPYHRAKLNHVDVSEALKVPGVYAVITKDDVPHNLFAMVPDHHVFAEELIRYRGQNIAAVAAVSKEVALEALGKIKLDIEELPYVIDPIEATKPDAPKVRPEGNMHMFDGTSEVRKIRKGNVEKGFAEADYIVEGTYTTPSQEHAPLETSSSVAYVDEAGKLVIHSKTQGLYFTQGDLANVFQLPLNKLKLVGGTVGGGFGAMNSVHTDHIAGLLALATGKPVKFQLTREEEMLYTTIRSPWIFKFKDGVKKDGTLTARQIEVLHDCGAYTELGLYAVEKNANIVAGATKVENVAVDARMVYTNKMPSGSMRGFGVNVGQFADQVQMDRLARKIGMNPIEFRLKNAFKENDINHVGNTLTAVSEIETLKMVAEMAGEEISPEYANMSSK